MCGPTAAILLRDRLSSGEVGRLPEWFAPGWEHQTRFHLWELREPATLGLRVLPGPVGAFEWRVEPWQPDDDRQADTVQRCLGYRPHTELLIAALLNGPADHLVLAHLAAALARHLDAYIDLTGPLPTEAAADPLLARAGRAYEIPYQTALGHPATYHLVDAHFLQSWPQHPSFRMIH
jgi:hypothetical protein